MILAFDTYYPDSRAYTVCIAFAGWTASEVSSVYSETLDDIAPYTPGEFYRRELPCILSLLAKIEKDSIEAIVIDGFVYLDDSLRLGLGGHLYHALDKIVPVIGVAKSNFATIEHCKREVIRGDSERPLYVTAIGMDADVAASHIKHMTGPFRVPTLLKQLDTLTRRV